MEKLLNIRWAKDASFQSDNQEPDYWYIHKTDLYYLYEAVLAFNHPIINEPILQQCFDFARTDRYFIEGQLDAILATWR